MATASVEGVWHSHQNCRGRVRGGQDRVGSEGVSGPGMRLARCQMRRDGEYDMKRGPEASRSTRVASVDASVAEIARKELIVQQVNGSCTSLVIAVNSATALNFDILDV